MTVGYSGTPLAKKLGIDAGDRVFVHGAPRPYAEIVPLLPPTVVMARRVEATTNIIHLFTTQQSELSRLLKSALAGMAQGAAIWVSWPKQAAKVPTDITEDAIRAIALPLGLVDIKVCAVDEIWSGLKLVIRKELRGKPNKTISRK
jgi:hypothetical protein